MYSILYHQYLIFHHLKRNLVLSWMDKHLSCSIVDVEDDYPLAADSHNATKAAIILPINLTVMIPSFQDITYPLNVS